jgi:hypothetical protein
MRLVFPEQRISTDVPIDHTLYDGLRVPVTLAGCLDFSATSHFWHGGGWSVSRGVQG